MSENLRVGAQGESKEKRIIVSRSHAGAVEEVAKKSLGDVTITPAGGAGKSHTQHYTSGFFTNNTGSELSMHWYL